MSDKHATLENRDGFQSKWGFILACIGSAVGMGNIWRFPIMVQQFGGMTFLIPYFLFVLLIGSTGIIEEFALGRWAQGGPVIAFGKATEERTGNKRLGEAIGAPHRRLYDAGHWLHRGHELDLQILLDGYFRQPLRNGDRYGCHRRHL